MVHLGDITKINGADIPPVDIITGGSPCFPAGTLVMTDRGYIPIEEVTTDDRVLTHRGRWRRVTAVGNRMSDTIVLTDGLHNIECTPNHPIYSQNISSREGADWTPACDMLHKNWAHIGNDAITWHEVTEIKSGTTNVRVYNMSVEEDESYTANRIIVHNCQDMSLAGKRQGLSGARSGLFHEMIRIIGEMRKATDGAFPKYAVYENVPGALSSNKGEDFETIIRSYMSLAGQSLECTRPEKWENAGCVMRDDFSIAWRVLNARYWGVPQMRRRIFLVASFRDGGGQRLRRYYLSAKACAGILRRAKERKKEIPEILLEVLKRQAQKK